MRAEQGAVDGVDFEDRCFVGADEECAFTGVATSPLEPAVDVEMEQATRSHIDGGAQEHISLRKRLPCRLVQGLQDPDAAPVASQRLGVGQHQVVSLDLEHPGVLASASKEHAVGSERSRPGTQSQVVLAAGYDLGLIGEQSSHAELCQNGIVDIQQHMLPPLVKIKLPYGIPRTA